MTEEVVSAATVVIMRDRADGPPELLMVERSAAMRFAGGAAVFPGGRVDAGDVALAGGDAERAARIAAVRECIEEAGVAPGVVPTPDAGMLFAIRSRLQSGESIGTVLPRGSTIDPAALVPFARWLPRGVSHRIFDTRFYLARLSDGTPEPLVDGTENTRAFWATARDVLADADAGRATIIFPTRRNLERLALFDSFADAVAHARAHPIRTITPWTDMRDGIPHLCIPDDLGYPVTAEPMASVRRA